MKFSLHGNISKKVISCIGTWNPITYERLNVLNFIKQEAKINHLNSCVILLYPPPGDIINKRKTLYYCDKTFIIEQILSLGIDAVLFCYFEGMKDVESNAVSFIPAIQNFIQLDILYMSNAQSIGMGIDGTQQTISEMGKSMGFKLEVFPSVLFSHKYPYKNMNPTIKVRQLQQGNFIYNRKILPFPPTTYIKNKNKIRCNFIDGLYKVGFRSKLNSKIIGEIEANCSNGVLKVKAPSNIKDVVNYMVVLKRIS